MHTVESDSVVGMTPRSLIPQLGRTPWSLILQLAEHRRVGFHIGQDTAESDFTGSRTCTAKYCIILQLAEHRGV